MIKEDRCENFGAYSSFLFISSFFLFSPILITFKDHLQSTYALPQGTYGIEA
jgi:hypothetical protein